MGKSGKGNPFSGCLQWVGWVCRSCLMRISRCAARILLEGAMSVSLSRRRMCVALAAAVAGCAAGLGAFAGNGNGNNGNGKGNGDDGKNAKKDKSGSYKVEFRGYLTGTGSATIAEGSGVS